MKTNKVRRDLKPISRRQLPLAMPSALTQSAGSGSRLGTCLPSSKNLSWARRMLESGANYLSASGQLGTNDQMQSFGTPMPTTVLQRFLPVAALGRTHIDCRQSVAGPDGKRVRGGQLCEVQRSFVPEIGRAHV